MAGALVYAELADRRPEVGGQYAYLRDAYGQTPAFLYGWSLLLVIQSGGMAAVAITFARYFRELTELPLPDGAVAAAVLPADGDQLSGRTGRRDRAEPLMVLKIPAIGALVLGGWLFAPANPEFTAPLARGDVPPLGMIAAIGAAMTPVMFAYGGWQTASFVAAEMRDPRRDLVRALLMGVAGVVVLYTAVAFVCVYALGPRVWPNPRRLPPTLCGWRSGIRAPS